MIAYHGSPQKGLKNLEYKKETYVFGEEVLSQVEGEGIYLTVDKHVAESYAKSGSVYKVLVGGNIFDSTKEESYLEFLREVESEFNLQDFKFLDVPLMNEEINCLVSGDYSCSEFATKIDLLCSSEESIYNYLSSLVGYEDLMKYIKNKFNQFNVIKTNYPSLETTIFVCYDFSGSCLEILEEEEVRIDKKEVLSELISDSKLDIYTVVLLARKDLEQGNYESALKRLKIDLDKFMFNHPKLSEFLKNN